MGSCPDFDIDPQFTSFVNSDDETKLSCDTSTDVAPYFLK